MPFIESRLWIQKEATGSCSVLLPGIWAGKEYATPEAALEAAEHVLRATLPEGQSSEVKALMRQREALVAEMDALGIKFNEVDARIQEAEKRAGKQLSDIDALIEGGHILVRNFEMVNPWTERYGPLIAGGVTPYDVDRDGTIEHAEFGISWSWNRKEIPDELMSKIPPYEE